MLDEDDIDLQGIVLSHYRLSKIKQQHLKLQDNDPDSKLEPGDGPGSATAKNRKEERLTQIIDRLNELFVTDKLTDRDLVNYALTVRDKVKENAMVMMQIANNSPEQAMLGDFPRAVDDAVLGSHEAHKEQMMQLLADPERAAGFAKVVFDLLRSEY
jgi:type I restriction enzyme R subunit